MVAPVAVGSSPKEMVWRSRQRYQATQSKGGVTDARSQRMTSSRDIVYRNLFVVRTGRGVLICDGDGNGRRDGRGEQQPEGVTRASRLDGLLLFSRTQTLLWSSSRTKCSPTRQSTPAHTTALLWSVHAAHIVRDSI